MLVTARTSTTSLSVAERPVGRSESATAIAKNVTLEIGTFVARRIETGIGSGGVVIRRGGMGSTRARAFETAMRACGGCRGESCV